MSLEILEANQTRIVRDEEEEAEKLMLSMSIINFFKYCSKDIHCQGELTRQGHASNILKVVLHAEMTLTCAKRFKMLPIEIEMTQVGQHFSYIMKLVSSGYQSLVPYNYVSYRVLH